MGAEGEFHLQYERILDGVGEERSTVQRKCVCGSVISARIEACHHSLACGVLREKTSREMASCWKAAK